MLVSQKEQERQEEVLFTPIIVSETTALPLFNAQSLTHDMHTQTPSQTFLSCCFSCSLESCVRLVLHLGINPTFRRRFLRTALGTGLQNVTKITLVFFYSLQSSFQNYILVIKCIFMIGVWHSPVIFVNGRCTAILFLTSSQKHQHSMQ